MGVARDAKFNVEEASIIFTAVEVPRQYPLVLSKASLVTSTRFEVAKVKRWKLQQAVKSRISLRSKTILISRSTFDRSTIQMTFKNLARTANKTHSSPL